MWGWTPCMSHYLDYELIERHYHHHLYPLMYYFPFYFPLIFLPVAQRGSWTQGLLSGLTSTYDGVTSSGNIILSGVKLSQILPGAVPPLPKFPPSPPPIYDWHLQITQTSLYATYPPCGCIILGTWLSFPPPLIPLGFVKTVAPHPSSPLMCLPGLLQCYYNRLVF